MCTRSLILLFFISLWPSVSEARVLINEIQASNNTTISDEDGSFEDWIELYNPGSDTIDISWYGLSDTPENPFRWVFPEGTIIPPSEYLMVWASGKNRRDPGLPFHTNFSISQHGEPVLLTDYQGVRVDSVGPRRIPSDISYGRYPDGSEQWFYFSNPTPGEANDQPDWHTQAPEPVFTHYGGFYDTPFYLDIYTEEPAVIHYSLDGSEPTEDHPVWLGEKKIDKKMPPENLLSDIPTNPLEPERAHMWRPPLAPVRLAHVIRAKAFTEGGMPSATVTHTFFVDHDDQTAEISENPLPSEPFYPLPVISIVTDSLHFFDHDTGFYIPGAGFEDRPFNPPWGFPDANYFERGDLWERPASMEFFDPVDGRVFQQNIGIRIHGGASRAMPMKSLRLYARSEYGQARFEYPFFDHPDSHPDFSKLEKHNIPDDAVFNRLILRNSGQDFYRYPTMFRDALIQGLVRNFNMDTQSYRPVVHFINGEYWGIINIRERYDKHYLARRYDIDPENIDYLEGFMRVQEGTADHFRQYYAFLNNYDISQKEHYEHVKTLLDVDNFIDYNIANIFFVNLDWPANNRDYFRYRTPFNPDAPPGQDGRWRYMLFDTDFGFGHSTGESQAEYDMLSVAMGLKSATIGANPAWSTAELRTLWDNDHFRTAFINRFLNYLNSVFSPEHVNHHMDHYTALLEPVIEEHIERWVYPHRLSHWESHISMYRKFAEKRPEYAREHLREIFETGEDILVTVNLKGPDRAGYISVNKMDIHEKTDGITVQPYPWTGIYFSDLPIEIEAHPKKGYRFSGWEGHPEITSPILTLSSDRDTLVTALFERSSEVHFDPPPHILSDASFYFNEWPANAPAGTYPDHIIFQYMDREHPGQDAWAAGPVTLPYNLTSGTRINGLETNGLSFINDGGEDHHRNRLGAAVLALETIDSDNISVTWEAETLQANSRRYALRLEYRIGDSGLFKPVLDHRNLPVEYKSSAESGHSSTMGPVYLPAETLHQPYVQLRWRYYDIDESPDKNTKTPAELRLGSIRVNQIPTSAESSETLYSTSLEPNYPNPFNHQTMIPYTLANSSGVSFHLYSVDGRLLREFDEGHVSPGRHIFSLNMDRFPSGVYIIAMNTDSGQRLVRRITLIR
ncbi:CotH kinase family protein [Balneolaceae bacterium ANBcel3]|nr:CotH kinase family protein [Balneolaceae bacterium ANBcel3]